MISCSLWTVETDSPFIAITPLLSLFHRKYQIVMGKVDEEAFESGSLSKGSILESSTQTKQTLVVNQVFDNGTFQLHYVMPTVMSMN